MKKLLKLIMAMGLTALLLTACGGGEEKSTAKSVEPPKTEEKSEPEEEEKSGLSEADQVIFDLAQPKMESLINDFNALNKMIIDGASTSNSNWEPEVRAYLAKIYEEAEVLSVIEDSGGNRVYARMYRDYGAYMASIAETMLKALDGETLDWDDDYDQLVLHEREVRFYSKYGREIKEVLHEDMVAAKELSKINSVNATGSDAEIYFEVVDTHDENELRKTAMTEMLTLLKKLSENNDYDGLNIRFSSSTLSIKDEEGNELGHYLIDATFTAEARESMDFEKLEWRDLMDLIDLTSVYRDECQYADKRFDK